jgi:hypothetical protein
MMEIMVPVVAIMVSFSFMPFFKVYKDKINQRETSIHNMWG